MTDGEILKTGQKARVVLKNNFNYNGVVLSFDQQWLVLNDRLIGRIVLSTQDISRIEVQR